MALKDEKFESFLKRSVNSSVSDEARAYDAAVILSKTDSYAFRFVLVSGHAIHITDNPPKSILYSIPHSEICDVKQVHDTAKFLQKDLQDITQHIVVKHYSAQSNPSLTSLSNLQAASLVDRNNAEVDQKSSFFKSLFTSSSKKSPIHGQQFDPSTQSVHSGFNKNSSNNNNVLSTVTPSVSAVNRQTIKKSSFDLSDENPMSDTDSCSSMSENHVSPRSSAKWPDSDLPHCDVLEPAVCFSLANVEETHLYVLNHSSLIYPMLKSAWRDFLLSATLKIDNNKPESQQKKSPIQESVLNVLFTDLKKDIIQCHNQNMSIENVYKYVNELKLAVEQHSSLKRRFWIDNQLLTVLVEIFVKCTSFFSTNDVDQHADAIECCILIAETISIMIKGSEALSNCQHVLQQQSTTFYENFLRALLNVQLLKNSNITNQELTGLCDEYLEAAVDIFYYLIVIAEQIAWKAMEVTHPNLTSHTLFSAISKHPNLELFLDLLMRKCVSLWTHGDVKSSPDVTAAVVGSNSALTPSECVRLYRSFVVLYRIITKIRTAKHRACSKYKEEFKYYIRPDSVAAKIPESYPACAILRNVIRSVAVLVLPGQNSR